MITVINIDKFIRENKIKGPVISPQLYLGKSLSYHPQGLFSEEIFGLEGSKERRENFSWVEMHCDVIHPVIYDILQKRIFKKIDKLLQNELSFNIDEKGYLVEDPEGIITGMSSLKANIKRVRFKKGEDEEGDRNKVIDMLYKNISAGTFFMDRLLICAPEIRPPTVFEEKNEVVIDPLTNLYKKVIIASNQLKGVSGSLYDILSYNMQMIIRELYELIKVRVSKKSGLLRNNLLGRRVDFSGRAVISPNPNLDIGTAGIPLKMCCELFLPFMIYGILHSDYANSIPQEFHDEVKKFLGKESVLDLDLD